MRFGLLNFLIFIVFIGGVLGCWLMPGPWVEWKKIPVDNSVITNSIISIERDRILTLDYLGTIRLYSFPELKLIWTYTSTEKDPHPDIAFLGNPTVVVQLSYSTFKPDEVYERLNVSDAHAMSRGKIPKAELTASAEDFA